MTMTQISIITDREAFGPPLVSAGYKVDISRGERIGRVSSEWFSRPDDERYLSLGTLYAAVRARADRTTARTVETRTLRVEASRDNAERLALIVPGREEPIAPTHWSFGQMCSLVGAPAGYMRQLPSQHLWRVVKRRNLDCNERRIQTSGVEIGHRPFHVGTTLTTPGVEVDADAHVEIAGGRCDRPNGRR
jgi:hypothetical protein